MNKLHIADALDDIFEIFRRANKYIDETTPWILAKDESSKDRLATALYNLVEAIRHGAVLLQAFLPETSEKIFHQINTTATDFSSINTFGVYASGTKTNEKEVLFERIEVK